MKVLSLTIGFRKTIKIFKFGVTNFAANHKTLHFKSEILTSTIFFYILYITSIFGLFGLSKLP